MFIFGKKNPGNPGQADDPSQAPEAGEMAMDALASALRSMAEFALEQETSDIASFRLQAEAWAQHVTLAAPAPAAGGAIAAAASAGGRRDWEGVRQFVREYCRSSSKHAASVTSDLREVIWVFIRNFSQAFAMDEEADVRIREQISRLEQLVEASAASELKREVLGTVGTLTQTLEERRHRQRAQMSSLGETVRTLGSELESARREGETDPLTRVFNRRALDTYLARTVEMFRAFRHDTCLLVVDVDHFKDINDSCGHLVGDRILCEVADALAKVFLRKSDFVARFGGDEFAVVLRETALKDVTSLAERVLSRIRAVRVNEGDRELRVTVSLGAAALTVNDDAKAWFDRADRGLYAAKASGRDRLGIGEP